MDKLLKTQNVDPEYFRLFFSLSLDLFCIAGSDGYFKHLNPAWEKVLGYAVNDLRSQPFLAFVHPDDLEKTLATSQAAAEGEVQEFENRYRCKDGSYRHLQWNSRRHPTRDLIFAVAKDVTEQKRREEDLRQGRLRAENEKKSIHDLLSQVPALAAVVQGPEFVFEFANEGYCSLVGNRNLIGLPVREALPGIDDSILKILEKVYRTGEKFVAKDLPIKADWHANGKPQVRYFTFVYSPVKSSDEQSVKGIWCLAFETTEMKNLESRLCITERMASLGTMAAGIAHEVNNPLGYVMMALELISEQITSFGDPNGPSRNDILENLRSCEQGLERIQNIVSSLKSFTRADSENRGWIDVRKVIEGTIAFANSEIKHRARLNLDLGETPLVFGNEGQLGQVLLNLVINAAQAIPAGNVADNSITVATRTSQSGWVEISVSDTGCGIAPEAMEKIFEPFYTSKPVGQGTGLGLSICHGIVAGMKGNIRVESKPGAGSVFTVTLPPASLQPQPESPLVDSLENDKSTSSPRDSQILIVDDELQFAKTLGKSLASQYAVTVVGSVTEALSTMQKNDFDVVLCDVMMPYQTGIDLFETLQREQSKHVEKLVFMTGGGLDPKCRERLSGSGRKVLEKPFSIKEIQSLIADSMKGNGLF